MARRAEWKSLFAAVEAAGWPMRRIRHGWLCVPQSPGVQPIRLGGTPSDVRAVRNARAALRRAGLTV